MIVFTDTKIVPTQNIVNPAIPIGVDNTLPPTNIAPTPIIINPSIIDTIIIHISIYDILEGHLYVLHHIISMSRITYTYYII